VRGCEHCPGSHSGEQSCLATATAKARTWLLIEHPGPWPERVEQLTEPEPVAEAVRRAQRLGVRPQLIRQVGRRKQTLPLQVYVGCSLGEQVWLEGREIADPAELADLDLAEVAAGRRPGFGEPVEDPLLLVCTHGRRNVCCARSGAPLARHLSSRFGRVVWETTHVGGDRYAANLVCLPHGLYYGSLGTAEAVAAVEAYARGEVLLDRFRGRAGLPEPAQAAEHFVRAHTGTRGVDAVTVKSFTGTSPYEAVIDAGGIRYRVTVTDAEGPHECGPECQENVRSYVVTDLTLLNEAALV
jgi:hypothetical protein